MSKPTDSYEDSCVSRCRIESDTPPEVARLIEMLPPVLRNTVDVRTPCEKYPDLPTGIMVEDAEGRPLYFQPYMPLVVTRTLEDIDKILRSKEGLMRDWSKLPLVDENRIKYRMERKEDEEV